MRFFRINIKRCVGRFAAMHGLGKELTVISCIANKEQKASHCCEAFYFERFELADKPGPVVDSYSSRPAIAHRLKQPTRFLREQRIYYLK